MLALRPPRELADLLGGDSTLDSGDQHSFAGRNIDGCARRRVRCTRVVEHLEEALQIPRLAHQPIIVPCEHDVDRPGRDIRQHPLVGGALHIRVARAHVVVRVDVGDLVAPLAGKFTKILLLPLDAEATPVFGRFAYRCHQKPGTNHCNGTAIKAEPVDQAVEAMVPYPLSSPVVADAVDRQPTPWKSNVSFSMPVYPGAPNALVTDLFQRNLRTPRGDLNGQARKLSLGRLSVRSAATGSIRVVGESDRHVL